VRTAPAADGFNLPGPDMNVRIIDPPQAGSKVIRWTIRQDHPSRYRAVLYSRHSFMAVAPGARLGATQQAVCPGAHI